MSPGALPQANLKAAPLALYGRARPGAHWDGSIIFDCRFAIEEERFAQRSGYREAIAKSLDVHASVRPKNICLSPVQKLPGLASLDFPARATNTGTFARLTMPRVTSPMM